MLVAEDEPAVGTFLGELLARDYAVEVVADGELAWQAVQNHRPDLVLSDVQMPRLDGIRLTHRLRTHPLTATVPIILLTACLSPSVVARGQEAGANDVLLKPFRASEVLTCVQRHLAGKPGTGTA